MSVALLVLRYYDHITSKNDLTVLPTVFLGVSAGKNPPAMQETWVRSLGWEDQLDEGKGYPPQNSGLENSVDYIVLRVAKSRT